MLSISPHSHSRRSFITAGTLGIGSLALTDLLQARSLDPSVIRNKSVVLLFLGGGPPQHETFDPKMEATSDYRAMYGETQTSLPGVTFGSHFSGLAKHADKLAIVRCFSNGMTSHGPATAYMASGGIPLKPIWETSMLALQEPSIPGQGFPIMSSLVPVPPAPTSSVTLIIQLV